MGRVTSEPQSPRLGYRRLRPADLDTFHGLVTDPHVRRFLLDGQVVSREWTAQAASDSDALFDTRGVGIWLVSVKKPPTAPGDVVGFVGYRVFEELGNDPQLLYAFPKRHTGRGYATEAAGALVIFARDHAGFREIHAAVDEPNTVSRHVLEKIGFEPCGEAPGPFGTTIRLVLVDPVRQAARI